MPMGPQMLEDVVEPMPAHPVAKPTLAKFGLNSCFNVLTDFGQTDFRQIWLVLVF